MEIDGVTYQVAYDVRGTAHDIRGIERSMQAKGPLCVRTICRYESTSCGEPAALARRGFVTCLECLTIDEEEE